jgi:hypothetical protein
LQAGRTLCVSTPSPATLLYAAWSWPEYTKTPPQTGGSFYILTEKSPKTAFFIYKKPLTRHFVRNRSRMKNIFTSGYLELYLYTVSGVVYAPSHPD